MECCLLKTHFLLWDESLKQPSFVNTCFFFLFLFFKISSHHQFIIPIYIQRVPVGYSEDIYIVQGMHKEFGHSHVLLFKICLPNHIPNSVHQKKKNASKSRTFKSIKQQLWQLNFFFHYHRLIYKAEILVQQNVALKNRNCLN